MTMRAVEWKGKALCVYGRHKQGKVPFELSRVESEDKDITNELSIAEVEALEQAVIRQLFIEESK